MSRFADLYINRLGPVLVMAPAPGGRLRHLVEERTVALSRDSETRSALSRWIFADLPKLTLKDDWGNAYDHQVHTLLAGTLGEGEALIATLESEGLEVELADDFFVPFQTLDIHNRDSSDQLRQQHARAFALARREHPDARALVTAARDSLVLGG